MVRLWDIVRNLRSFIVVTYAQTLLNNLSETNQKQRKRENTFTNFYLLCCDLNKQPRTGEAKYTIIRG